MFQRNPVNILTCFTSHFLLSVTAVRLKYTPLIKTSCSEIPAEIMSSTQRRKKGNHQLTSSYIGKWLECQLTCVDDVITENLRLKQHCRVLEWSAMEERTQEWEEWTLGQADKWRRGIITFSQHIFITDNNKHFMQWEQDSWTLRWAQEEVSSPDLVTAGPRSPSQLHFPHQALQDNSPF